MEFDLPGIVQSHNPWWTDPGRRRAQAWPWRRDLQPRIVEQLVRQDRRALVLIGARQVGKTVMLLQSADDLLSQGLPPANLTYFDFLDERITQDVTCRQVADVRPSGFREDAPRVLLFDEVGHALGDWGRWVKGAVDREEAKICLTDSSASLLRPDGRESAFGRTDELRVETLSVSEIHRLFGGGSEDEDVSYVDPRLVERYLTLGGFPEYLASKESESDPPQARARLRRDIADKAIIRDLEERASVDVTRVQKLFTYLVQDSGAIFTVASRAQDLDADPRSVSEWTRLLEETCLLASLPRHGQRASSRLKGRPKIYAADPGLVAAFAVGDLGHGEIRGRLFEAAVFRHLRDLERSALVPASLSYFRSKGELDFVLEVGEDRVAIEVTSRAEARRDKLTKMRKANETLQADRLFLVYWGAVESQVEGIRILPLAQFLVNPGIVLKEGSES